MMALQATTPFCIRKVPSFISVEGRLANSIRKTNQQPIAPAVCSPQILASLLATLRNCADRFDPANFIKTQKDALLCHHPTRTANVAISFLSTTPASFSHKHQSQGHAGDTLRIWDVQKGVGGLFKGHKDRVRSVAVSALHQEHLWFLQPRLSCDVFLTQIPVHRIGLPAQREQRYTLTVRLGISSFTG
ncbi:hypothetical protein BDR04DRAFT_1155470 [Suillus decipiens]|nr:hypothetical protein BDR04DRAFT_1155470 [Suillus decipiens]